MAEWFLHFVGKEYYGRGSFVREARKHGVSRRIALHELRRMRWGDRVLLAIRDGKSSLVFGSFRVTRLSGLSAEATAAVEKRFGVEKISDGGAFVERGCGCYIEGPLYSVRADLPALAALLEELKSSGVDIGRPMVAGAFEPHEPVRLRNVPHRQGFRPFDYGRFAAAVEEARRVGGAGIPSVRGQFYRAPGPRGSGSAPGHVQEVKDYRRRAS
jgi:hypothetical protein